MAITGFTTSDNPEDYDYLMERYKRENLDMFFYDFRMAKNTKLGELKRMEIMDYIIFLRNPKSYTSKAWYVILSDVLIKNRQRKLEKIKKKINGNSK